MAASDVDYNQLPAEAKSKGEFQFLAKALAQAPNRIHQGIYVVSPSGRYIKQCNAGWPHVDTAKCHSLLKQALQAYRTMAKDERLAAHPLAPDQRSMVRQDLIEPPKDWIKIRTTTRSYPFEPMELFDQRHPDYYKLDRLWMTPQTARSLVPDRLEVGASSEVTGRALHHLTFDNHLMLGCPPWPDNSVKKARLHVRITAKKGNLYQLQYDGVFHLDSNSQWNKSAYKGKLLGKALWDENKKRFYSLHWVSLGERNRRVLRRNETRGSVHITHVGSVFELDPLLPNDHGITPHSWEDRYPREMKSEASRSFSQD